ncbi:hypothetical protein HPB49_001412 [Dermacentor silvarum]|uniref:Uncharacterized protein n=1 Tax=Dermacentor silvarum TaxID=543639 RepID=A0ACB8DSG9_DERSI|nr:hypothetical protein HPB49_001412 [Dermacentor silvarum]
MEPRARLASPPCEVSPGCPARTSGQRTQAMSGDMVSGHGAGVLGAGLPYRIVTVIGNVRDRRVLLRRWAESRGEEAGPGRARASCTHPVLESDAVDHRARRLQSAAVRAQWRHIEIFKSSLQEIRSAVAMGVPKMMRLMGTARPGPHDRTERFGVGPSRNGIGRGGRNFRAGVAGIAKPYARRISPGTAWVILVLSRLSGSSLDPDDTDLDNSDLRTPVSERSLIRAFLSVPFSLLVPRIPVVSCPLLIG